MITAACALFLFRIGRTALIVSFLCLYALQTLLRAYILRDHLPMETLLLGTLTSARFYLFTFYMMTDPKTSPPGKWQQIGWSLAVVLVDLWFHTIESLSTLFYALFVVTAARFLWLHVRAFWKERGVHLKRAFDRQLTGRVAVCGALGAAGFLAYAQVINPHLTINNPGFELVEVPPSVSGIDSQMSDVMNQTDPRVRHFAKWLMSIGDAIAIGDFDNDGLPDIFLTNPLKRPEDRNVLYRNLGNFRFERVEIPALREVNLRPEKYGFASGSIFVDYDNSGAQSLLLTFAYGKSRLLKNMLPVEGKPEFVDMTNEAGIGDYSTSVAATFFDYDRDGKLDLLVGNSFAPYFEGLPHAYSLEHLPPPPAGVPRRPPHVPLYARELEQRSERRAERAVSQRWCRSFRKDGHSGHGYAPNPLHSCGGNRRPQRRWLYRPLLCERLWPRRSVPQRSRPAVCSRAGQNVWQHRQGYLQRDERFDRRPRQSRPTRHLRFQRSCSFAGRG